MKPTIICLTPVRNEAWVLDRFLKAASLWADYIIIADQMSTDGSREIAKSYPKVILIDNPSETFNEPERQKLLIDEARKIEGPRLLITLDADEMFTPNVLTSIEWQTLIISKAGTIFNFQWANFASDMQSMWYGYYFPWGYMDDGCEHKGDNKIHSGRIPLPPSHDVVDINQIKVIHFQYTNWTRMQSKHRFYQCFETINFPKRSAVDIFRQYHHMLAIPKKQIIPIPNEWIEEYNQLGVDLTFVNYETKNWFEIQVLNLIELYGAKAFKKFNIWDVNWEGIAKLWGKTNIDVFKDPRSMLDKWIQNWLLETQGKLDNRKYRRIDRLIKFIFRY